MQTSKNAIPFLLALLAVCLVSVPPAIAEETECTIRMDQDPNLDNLVHRPGYEAGVLGELGRVRKSGSGSRAVILVAGAGFGGDVFESLMRLNEDQYIMYAATMPGFGGTAAPPMPEAGVSYGGLKN
jgi:hypothetical protein